MIKHKFLPLLVALCATTALWASNTITYTATEKLEETTDAWSAGLHINAFDVSISSHTFSNGEGTITFDGDVTTIGYSAFYECSGLTSVTIGNSVTTIGGYAFYDCKGLTSITIGNSVETIGEWAFAYCSGFTSITIPNSVTTIGERAFEGCTSLPIVDNIRYADTYLIEAVDKSLSTYTIKEGIKWIGDYAFSDCSGLTSVTIPNSVTTIGKRAFENCYSLTSVTIPNSVTTIGDWAFGYCSGLTSVTIPNSVTSIGQEAFSFVNNIVYNGTATGSPWWAKCINGYVDGYWVYNDATKTTLCGCSSAVIGAITIPNSVTTIGEYAFSGCSGLTSITCEATTPPTCRDDCFYDVDKSIPLYVPAGSVDAYKAADEWKEFTDIRSITAKDVEVTEIEADPTESAVEIAWPSVVNAETYTIEIRLGDQLICSIVFNAEGQLVSINFNLAPGRGGHTYATTAESTATGWAYTIAGLTPGTKYTYSVIAKNADEQVIDTKSGSFTTQGLPTSIDNMGNNFNNSYVNPTKSLRNGQVIIRKNNKTYNTLGQEVK